MTPTETFEAHFWKLFDELPETLFRKLADMDKKRYDACRRYHTGKRQTRPMNVGIILSTREKLLDALDEYERNHDLGIIA